MSFSFWRSELRSVLYHACCRANVSERLRTINIRFPSSRYAEASRGVSFAELPRSIQLPESSDPGDWEFQNSPASKMKLSRKGDLSPHRIIRSPTGRAPQMSSHHAGQPPTSRKLPSPRYSKSA